MVCVFPMNDFIRRVPPTRRPAGDARDVASTSVRSRASSTARVAIATRHDEREASASAVRCGVIDSHGRADSSAASRRRAATSRADSRRVRARRRARSASRARYALGRRDAGRSRARVNCRHDEFKRRARGA